MDIQIENLSLKELVELHDKVARRMWELGRTELAAKLGTGPLTVESVRGFRSETRSVFSRKVKQSPVRSSG